MSTQTAERIRVTGSLWISNWELATIPEIEACTYGWLMKEAAREQSKHLGRNVAAVLWPVVKAYDKDCVRYRLTMELTLKEGENKG